MKRWSFFVYGVSCHLLFLITYACMAWFVAGLPSPRSIDTPAEEALGWVLLIDLALIALFGVQHSIMARPWFKRIWTKLIPQPIERSTYVLISCVCVFVLMWQWGGLGVCVLGGGAAGP